MNSNYSFLFIDLETVINSARSCNHKRHKNVFTYSIQYHPFPWSTLISSQRPYLLTISLQVRAKPAIQTTIWRQTFEEHNFHGFHRLALNRENYSPRKSRTLPQLQLVGDDRLLMRQSDNKLYNPWGHCQGIRMYSGLYRVSQGRDETHNLWANEKRLVC